MLKTFIERPVLSAVISIIIIVLGIIGIYSLPIEQYPDIAPPTVQVTTAYSGANADAVLNSVIIPLEEQINGVEGMTYMTSYSFNGGGASINVYFKKGIDPDMATVNVQNRVSQASALLPAEVTKNGTTVKKKQNSNILMILLKSKNPDYDEKFIQNYANINILPRIKRVAGVGDAIFIGESEYAMRVWLRPDVMKAYNITPAEVIAALQDQNIESAPGELGANSNQTFQFALKYTGRLKSIEEFENIIIRSQNAQVLRIKDVARVELGKKENTIITRSGKYSASLIGVSQVASSNAQEIISQIKKEMENASKNFPVGLEVEYQIDASDFLYASINKVLQTLFEAFILVFFVVLIFLQSFRATLIPAIAVPVSVIGTFFFLSLFGFSINLLTLFALVLAIGIVVDNAIVVVEAVHTKLEAGETDAKKASVETMQEIAPAIVAITLVMSAVFVPVSFIGGTSGIFFKQFGLTLAVAILISAVNALTLSPALCAILLKTKHNLDIKDKNIIKRFYYFFNLGLSITTKKYKRSLHYLSEKKHRWVTISIVALFSIILVVLMKLIPSGFIPQEDSGLVMGSVILPPGSSIERTDSITKEVIHIIESIPDVKEVTSLTGTSLLSGTGSSYGMVVIKMKSWNRRKITTNEVVGIVKQKTDSIPNATFMFFGMPTLQGFGNSSGIEMMLQDKTGGDINKFYTVATEFIGKLQQRPEVMVATSSFDARFPQKLVEADIAKIKDAGLTLNEVMSALQAYVGSMYVSNFNIYGKLYRVIVQASPEYRTKLEDLHNLTVKTANGTMAPITEFINIKDITGPQFLNRFNLFTAIDVTIIPNMLKGYTSGDVIKAIKELNLPEGYDYDFSGMTREEVNASNQTVLIFLLCLIFVYFLLSALYESFLLPLAVILSLPVGLAGVFIFVFISMSGGSGIANNIYVQISLIMLIGMLAKNSILIVEYAIQRRRHGMSIVKSAINGAVIRLRPILMTSFALIFGLLPLAVATGAGAVGNKSIGISAIGGMLIGTIFGVLVVPVLFILFQSLQERLSKHKIETIDDTDF